MFLICACLGGMALVIRIVMQLVGADSDMDVDGFDGDLDIGDSDVSFHILTVHGLTAFFTMFGLAGLSLDISLEQSAVVAIIGAFCAGLASLFLINKIMMAVAGLQSSGTLNLRNAIGQSGSIYLTIPEGGTGKAQVTVQGRLQILDAVSQNKEEIATGGRIVVADVVDSTLIVRKDSV